MWMEAFVGGISNSIVEKCSCSSAPTRLCLCSASLHLSRHTIKAASGGCNPDAKLVASIVLCQSVASLQGGNGFFSSCFLTGFYFLVKTTNLFFLFASGGKKKGPKHLVVEIFSCFFSSLLIFPNSSSFPRFWSRCHCVPSF